MDVSPEAIIEAMGEHRVTYLVHGHTHRPAVHSLDVAGQAAVRVVLGDWYEQDSVLVWSKDGYRLGRVRDLQA
jgi:UDP-2,3-diacylglucosamine hydrolase